MILLEIVALSLDDLLQPWPEAAAGGPDLVHGQTLEDHGDPLHQLVLGDA